MLQHADAFFCRIKYLLEDYLLFRGCLTEGTNKLWFDSVWMGVTGGAMVGATSRRGFKVKIFVKQDEMGNNLG